MPCISVGDGIALGAFPDGFTFAFQHLMPDFTFDPFVIAQSGVFRIDAKVPGFVSLFYSEG